MKFDCFHRTFGTKAFQQPGKVSFVMSGGTGSFPCAKKKKKFIIFNICRAVIARGVKWS